MESGAKRVLPILPQQAGNSFANRRVRSLKDDFGDCTWSLPLQPQDHRKTGGDTSILFKPYIGLFCSYT